MMESSQFTNRRNVDIFSDRALIPARPFGWDSNSQKFMSGNKHLSLTNLKTYNYYNYEDACEALLVAIRRCNFEEAAFWAVEIFLTSEENKYDLMQRLLVYCSSEIGPANLTAIVIIDKIMGIDFHYLHFTMNELIKCVEFITNCYKDRTFAWMGVISDGYVGEQPFLNNDGELQFPKESEEIRIRDGAGYNFDDLMMVIGKFEIALKDYKMEEAMNLAHLVYKLQDRNPLCLLTPKQASKLKKLFECPPTIKNLKYLTQTLWLPLITLSIKPRPMTNDVDAKMDKNTAQSTCDLISHLYHIAWTRNGFLKFKNYVNHNIIHNIGQTTSSTINFLMHGIYAYCNSHEIKDPEPDLLAKPLTIEDNTKFIQDLVFNVTNRLALRGLPKSITTTLPDVLTIGCRLEQIIPHSRDRQIMYFTKAIQTMISLKLCKPKICEDIDLNYLVPY